MVFLIIALRVIIKNKRSKDQRASTGSAKDGAKKSLARFVCVYKLCVGSCSYSYSYLHNTFLRLHT